MRCAPVLLLGALMLSLVPAPMAPAEGATLRSERPLGIAAPEPSEQQMRLAFERFLAAMVEGALALAIEIGGPEAVRRIQDRGHDRFAIHSFHKLGCTPAPDGPGHDCRFAVELVLVDGPLRRDLAGRFSPTTGGLIFADGR